MARRFPLFLLLLLIALLIGVAIELLWGAYPLSLNVLWGEGDPLAQKVLLDLRVPRAVAAIMVGGTLALSGAVLQLLLGNPLAEPGLLGISGGASLMAALAIVLVEFATPGGRALVLSLAAFVGALLVTLLLFFMAQLYRFRGSPLLLLGVAIGMLTTAGITWFFLYADDRSLRELLYWSMGSFSIAVQLGYSYLLLLVPIIIWLLLQSAKLNLLLLGERSAFALGLDLHRFRPRLILAVALMTGCCVALCGVIGFVGLLIPHLLRLLIGNDQRVLLPCAFVGGGALMLFADALARNLLTSAELPVGIITATVGAPVFIMLLVRRHAQRF